MGADRNCYLESGSMTETMNYGDTDRYIELPELSEIEEVLG